MYTTIEDYLNYFNLTQSDLNDKFSYEIYEEIAIADLMKYNPNFPSQSNFELLDQVCYSKIKHAIFWQIQFISLNIENWYGDGVTGTATIKIGSTQINPGNNTDSALANSKIGSIHPIAKRLVESSCVGWRITCL